MREQIIRIFHNMIGTKDVQEPQDSFGTSVENQAEGNGLADPADQKTFEKAIEEVLGEEQAQGCFLVIGLDRFKEVNHIYGYDVGDALLSHTAGILREVFGGRSYLGRLDGDKFAVWMPEESESSIEHILRRVGVVNDRLLHPTGALPPVSLSAGAAFCQAGDDYRNLEKKAHKSLHRVKEGGRCGCEIYGQHK